MATCKWPVLALAAVLALGPSYHALAGDAPSSATIENALKPLKTRGFNEGPPPRDAHTREFIDSLKGRHTRAITVEERKQVVKIVSKEKLPSIDLEILFEYDSARLQSKSIPGLMNLGKALTSGSLDGATIMIAGHTDATGSDGYNLGLSNRRAASVKDFLVHKFNKLNPNLLVAVGFGEEQLKNPADPAGGENRRVQVVNLAGKGE